MSIDIYGAGDNLTDEIEAVARGWSLNVNHEDAMNVDELRQELGRIHRVNGDDRVQVWITPAARRLVGSCEQDKLVKVTRDAFRKAAHDVGQLAEPIAIGHYENPDVLFVGMRAGPRGPYQFVLQAAVGEPVNWLALMSEAFMDANRAASPWARA